VYRIPPDLDLEGLIGSDLAQICLGRYQVNLHFDGRIIVQVESAIQVLETERVIAEWDQEMNWSSAAFQRIVNETVASWSVLDDRCLEIAFGNGLSLRLYDNSDQYESMQILYLDPPKSMVVI
jgi:hypothetical protein